MRIHYRVMFCTTVKVYGDLDFDLAKRVVLVVSIKI